MASIAAGLEAGLAARAPDVHAGTPLVRKLAVRIAQRLGLDHSEQMMVDVCAQLRDIGMIDLPDTVVLNTGLLSPTDLELMNSHPQRGAELLRSVSGMAWAAKLVRAHHERWDGEGYPDGLGGDAIPLASRVVAVCDAFVAIATDRPHRRGIGAEAALDYIVQERGSQFDPTVVDCLVATLAGKECGAPRSPSSDAAPPSPRKRPNTSRGESRDLLTALAELDVVPVFAPACDRALAAAASAGSLGRGELVAAIERDVGLTVAVLRLAQSRSHTPVVGVAGAVAAVGGDEIRIALEALPRLSFPWQTSFEALLLRSAVHAQAVARSVDRLAHMLRPFERDELVAAALIHDVGKLLLLRIWPDFTAATAVTHTPEDLIARERRELGYDHASLGGLLAERWGLAPRLVATVCAHHRARRASDAATLVRLADMLVHHAHGDTVDRHVMLRLAADCELSANTLREIVFDLPPAGRSARRRAEPSPLSTREAAILRLLADGRRNTQIARELHLTESTVRSHLHNIYAKLEVPDRAQAVLKATEMAWV